ncbi:MAG: hypothetical protein V9G10_17140 [Candidatus Nanopelagicales bacterium]
MCDAVAEARTTWNWSARVDLGDDLALVDDCDVVVDFTAPDVVMQTVGALHPRRGARGRRDQRLRRRSGWSRYARLLAGHPASECWSHRTSASGPCS